MGLLQELAIAYAIIPHFAGEEYLEDLLADFFQKEWEDVTEVVSYMGGRNIQHCRTCESEQSETARFFAYLLTEILKHMEDTDMMFCENLLLGR